MCDGSLVYENLVEIFGLGGGVGGLRLSSDMYEFRVSTYSYEAFVAKLQFGSAGNGRLLQHPTTIE